MSTFHAACVRILRRYIDRIGFDNNFTIYDMDDQKTVMKDVCKRLQIDTKMLKERAILSAISSAKDELISPQDYQIQAMGDFPFPHLSCRFISKSNCHNVVWAYAYLIDQISDPVRQNPGLPAARPR